MSEGKKIFFHLLEKKSFPSDVFSGKFPVGYLEKSGDLGKFPRTRPNNFGTKVFSR